MRFAAFAEIVHRVLHTGGASVMERYPIEKTPGGLRYVSVSWIQLTGAKPVSPTTNTQKGGNMKRSI